MEDHTEDNISLETDYKKHNENLLFLVPEQMEKHVLFKYHNEMGHIGKMIDIIRRTYWFPHMREKCENHIKNCLKCISFSPQSGKAEGYLNPIPKGNTPFETLHIDHYVPVNKCFSKKVYPSNSRCLFKIYQIKSYKNYKFT